MLLRNYRGFFPSVRRRRRTPPSVVYRAFGAYLPDTNSWKSSDLGRCKTKLDRHSCLHSRDDAIALSRLCNCTIATVQRMQQVESDNLTAKKERHTVPNDVPLCFYRCAWTAIIILWDAFVVRLGFGTGDEVEVPPLGLERLEACFGHYLAQQFAVPLGLRRDDVPFH